MNWNGIELPEKNIYFKDDDSLIYCADCREVLPLIPDKSIDLVPTSPPYDKQRVYGGYEWEFEITAREINRLINDGGIIVWIVGDAVIDRSDSGSSFKQVLYFKRARVKTT